MDELLKDTIEIARAAGAAIMEYYNASFDVKDKEPDNPVTDADYAADNLLKEQLLDRFPEAGWLSEETVDSPHRLLKKKVWVVDPLDGTKEFVKGIPEFSISIALAELGHPILGVIYNPAKDEIFYCERGEGVFFNDEPVTVTERKDLEGAQVDASRTELERGEFEPFEELVSLNPVGSIAYKLARVAAGQADATWSRGPKNEWDICAGVLFVREAGGSCVDLDDDPFTFNRPDTKVSGVIADNGHLHKQVKDTLAPHRDSART